MVCAFTGGSSCLGDQIRDLTSHCSSPYICPPPSKGARRDRGAIAAIRCEGKGKSALYGGSGLVAPHVASRTAVACRGWTCRRALSRLAAGVRRFMHACRLYPVCGPCGTSGSDQSVYRTAAAGWFRSMQSRPWQKHQAPRGTRPRHTVKLRHAHQRSQAAFKDKQPGRTLSTAQSSHSCFLQNCGKTRVFVRYEQQQTACDAKSQPDVIHVAERFCQIPIQQPAGSFRGPLNGRPALVQINRAISRRAVVVPSAVTDSINKCLWDFIFTRYRRLTGYRKCFTERSATRRFAGMRSL